MSDPRIEPSPGQPAIWFRRVSGVSCTRLGGNPSLPAGMDWPTEVITGLPLHFIGQIDLGALPRYAMVECPEGNALPPNGMLFFFCLVADRELTPTQLAVSRAHRGLEGVRNATRVLYAEAPGPDRSVPDNLLHAFFSDSERTFPVVPLQAYWIAASSDDPDDPAMLDAIVAAIGDLGPVTTGGDLMELIHGQPVWSMMLMFADKLYSGRGELDGIDETPTLLMSFRDGHFLQDLPGFIEYWILPSDLRTRRFDKAWAIMAN